MKVAILQPYIFPYLGYFQLIKAVDLFVLYDDVNFMKKGWIHRNNILMNGEPHLFTIPCIKISQNKMINKTYVCGNLDIIEQLLTNFKRHYKKAPYFEQVFPIIEKVLFLAKNEPPISDLVSQSIFLTTKYLMLDANFEMSSQKYAASQGMDKVDRIVSICKENKARTYINAIGGLDLYNKQIFKEQDITLKFLDSKGEDYIQFDNEFVPNLSIIDVMMFNSPQKINSMLDHYELV